jgi:hypothetical protein
VTIVLKKYILKRFKLTYVWRAMDKITRNMWVWLEPNIGVFQTSLVQAHITCPTLLESNVDGFGLNNLNISYQNFNQNWMKFKPKSIQDWISGTLTMIDLVW